MELSNENFLEAAVRRARPESPRDGPGLESSREKTTGQKTRGQLLTPLTGAADLVESAGFEDDLRKEPLLSFKRRVDGAADVIRHLKPLFQAVEKPAVNVEEGAASAAFRLTFNKT